MKKINLNLSAVALLVVLIVFTSVYPAPKERICPQGRILVTLYKNGKVVGKATFDGWVSTTLLESATMNGKRYHVDKAVYTVVYK